MSQFNIDLPRNDGPVRPAEIADLIRRCELHGERGQADALTVILGRMGRNLTATDSYDADEPRTSAYSRGLTRAGKLAREGVAS